MDVYELMDSGNGKKWERFGPFSIVRPCAQAVWKSKSRIDADASFSREPENRWQFKKKLPASWIVSVGGVKMKIAPTDFGHLGVFPEHALL